MQKSKKSRKLSLTTETVRTLTQERLSRVAGGVPQTHSYCASEAESCSGCLTASTHTNACPTATAC
jgi:hypothetical protein